VASREKAIHGKSESRNFRKGKKDMEQQDKIENLLEINQQLRNEVDQLTTAGKLFAFLYAVSLANERDENGSLIRPGFYSPETLGVIIDLLESKQATTIPQAYLLAKKIGS